MKNLLKSKPKNVDPSSSALFRNGSSRKEDHEADTMLKRHRLHLGVYARVAEELGVDASYISRVASGERKSEKVKRSLVLELKRIERLTRDGSH